MPRAQRSGNDRITCHDSVASAFFLTPALLFKNGDRALLLRLLVRPRCDAQASRSAEGFKCADLL
jgi:hypothetical protein